MLRDSTALVACSVEQDGRPHHLELLELWENTQQPGWTVSGADVEAKIVEACARFRVEEIAADPSLWRKSLETLGERYPVVEAPQSPSRMVPATNAFYQAVMNGQVTHDGNADLARHLANAVRRPVGTIAKPSKSSPRRIDAAVAAVMSLAHARAQPESRVPMVAFR
jgi:phage terminase large subunit-like protein